VLVFTFAKLGSIKILLRVFADGVQIDSSIGDSVLFKLNILDKVVGSFIILSHAGPGVKQHTE
jgi:hypothetical protein